MEEEKRTDFPFNFHIVTFGDARLVFHFSSSVLEHCFQNSRHRYKTFVILVPKGHVPFGQHQESRPLARSNNISVLNGFVNTIH